MAVVEPYNNVQQPRPALSPVISSAVDNHRLILSCSSRMLRVCRVWTLSHNGTHTRIVALLNQPRFAVPLVISSAVEKSLHIQNVLFMKDFSATRTRGLLQSDKAIEETAHGCASVEMTSGRAVHSKSSIRRSRSLISHSEFRIPH